MKQAPCTSSPPCVFVIEDEPKLASLLEDYLHAEGFSVRILHEGGDAVEILRQENPDLILLDLMLPGKNGMDICREVRTFSQVPIIMITARVEEIDRLIGLELGADDYICKPFSPREVVARVKAVLRRLRSVGGAVITEGFRSSTQSNFTMNADGFQFFYNGKALDLTPGEFRLLRLLTLHPGKVFSRDQLLTALYDDGRIVTDRTIDTHIKNLRRKLEIVAPEREYIISIYSVGYKFDPS